MFTGIIETLAKVESIEKEQSNVHSIHDPLSFKDIDMSLKVRHRKMSSLQIESI